MLGEKYLLKTISNICNFSQKIIFLILFTNNQEYSSNVIPFSGYVVRTNADPSITFDVNCGEHVSVFPNCLIQSINLDLVPDLSFPYSEIEGG